MRLAAVISLLILLTLRAGAVSPYFSTREGERMHYVRRNASNNKVVWTYDASVDSVYAGGINFTYDFHRPGGGQMYGGPLRLKMEINGDGDIMVDVASTMKTYVHNLFPRMDVRAEGGKTVLPAAMKPGDTLPDVVARARVLGMNYVVTYTERKVISREDFNAPAGTFACTVVGEHKVESGLGINRDVRTLTWYSVGLGVVKHETYDWKTGKLLTIETLESIEQ